MKQLSNLSIIGILIGICFSLLSAMRYWITYTDYDRLIAYVIIGFLISMVSLLYGRQRQMRMDFDYLEDKLQEYLDKPEELDSVTKFNKEEIKNGTTRTQ